MINIDTLERLASQVDMLLSDNLIQFARLVIEQAEHEQETQGVKEKLKEFFESQDPIKLAEALR